MPTVGAQLPSPMARTCLPTGANAAIVRERVEGMTRHRGLAIEAVDLHVITVLTRRLDRDPHRTRLFQTAKRIRPRLLLLDPLVRLHGIDENHATEVAQLLAYFRISEEEKSIPGIDFDMLRDREEATALTLPRTSNPTVPVDYLDRPRIDYRDHSQSAVHDVDRPFMT